tara:strand:+ start:101306 stop:103591 length:2286 start_codon:yes stop_codon:yes gene_type:complete
MIQRVIKVNGFGILDNFKKEYSVKPFNKFNLIYGWNGSGKTTLARLLRCIETRCNHDEYKGAEFSIQLDDSSKIESTSYTHSLDIKVFNQDFINDNLNLFDAETDPIVFISKQKVEEKKELDSKKAELLVKEKELKDFKKEEQDLVKRADDFHKNAGKAIKDFLLGTIYANVTYNKKTSSDIWKGLKNENADFDTYELSEESLTDEKNYTLLNSKKDEIPSENFPSKISIDKLSEIEREVNNLLDTNITSNVISRLRDNPDIGDWVSTGLVLHKKHESENCEFCGKPLEKERTQTLDAHFNKEFDELKTNITNQINKLEKGKRSKLSNEKYLLYDSLKEEYDTAITTTNEKIDKINGVIDNWINSLSSKKANPFSPCDTALSGGVVFSEFNEELDKLTAVIQKHNDTSLSHKELAEQAKQKIEFHFVSQSAVSENLPKTEQNISGVEQSLKTTEEEISSLKESIKRLENELKSDTLAIQEIEENLHKFIGRNDIMLERQESGGYQLKRGNVVARNLSEGEKTAISLIYFFSKIKENDANIADQIIVLDDPISSFDSNHLFNASSLIKQSTEGAKQLFVLTHNFWFFKQVRDWMLKKFDKASKQSLSNIYIAQNGVLSDAKNSLLKFHSEYHYVFNSVIEYQNLDELDDSACFTIANSVRRLLEAFTSFKTPDNSGFNGALQLGIKHGLTNAQKERIFYFLNKYSHLDRIESFDNTVETLLEEGKNVIDDVLWLVKKVDEDHYKSMLKVCGFEDKLDVKAIK